MDWLELARILSPAAVALAGLGIALLRVLDRHLHRRALAVATPEEIEVLKQMPQPSPLLRLGGPTLVLMALGGVLAGWIKLPGPERMANRATVGDFQPDHRPHGLPTKEASHVQD